MMDDPTSFGGMDLFYCPMTILGLHHLILIAGLGGPQNPRRFMAQVVRALAQVVRAGS